MTNINLMENNCNFARSAKLKKKFASLSFKAAGSEGKTNGVRLSPAPQTNEVRFSQNGGTPIFKSSARGELPPQAARGEALR